MSTVDNTFNRIWIFEKSILGAQVGQFTSDFSSYLVFLMQISASKESHSKNFLYNEKSSLWNLHSFLLHIDGIKVHKDDIVV